MIGRLAHVAAAALLLPLAACVNMSGLGGDSKYACAAPEGVTCESLSGTYANAIHNNLPSQRRASSGSASEVRPDASRQVSMPGPRQPPNARPESAAPDTDALAPVALRSQARYLRLWIKPWEDIDGDLFDQAHVYVQIDHGRWQIEHVQRAIRERYAPLRPPPSTSTATGSAAPDAPSDAAPATAADVRRPDPVFPLLGNTPTGRGGRPSGSPQ